MLKKSTYKIVFGMTLFLTFCLTNLNGQKVEIGVVDLDSVYVQIGFLEKNDSVLQCFKLKFTEKDSLMVLPFIKKCQEFEQSLQHSDPSPIEYEKRKNKLAEEQQRIQKFEKSLEEATLFLEKTLKQWSEDYIKKEIRFVFYSQNYKTILIKKEILITSETPENITQLIINSIKNNNQWASDHADFVKSILNKTIFDFQLE